MFMTLLNILVYLIKGWHLNKEVAMFGTDKINKRGREGGQEEGLPSQRRVNIVFPDQFFGTVCPIVVNTYEDLARNVVWINRADFRKFFHKNYQVNDSNQYIQIAKNIYQVAVKEWISPSCIGLTPLQFQEIKDFNVIYNDSAFESVQIATLFRAHRTQSIASITFVLSSHDGYNSFDSKMVTYDLAELRQRCHFLLNEKFSTIGQQFLIDLPKGRCKLKSVKQLNLNPDNEFSPASLITSNTLFEFRIAEGENISIARQEAFDADVKFNFKVTLENDDETKTFFIDLDELKQKINSALSGKSLCTGDRFSIKHNDRDLQISFSGLKGNQLASNHKHYCSSYYFEQNPICLTTANHISFIKNEINPAKELAVEVYSVNRKAKAPRAGRFLDVRAIEEAIKNYKTPFIIGQLATLNLKNEKVVVDIKNATPVDPLVSKESKKFKRQWGLTEDCKISLTTKRILRWCLVDNLDSVEVKKVEIKLFYRSYQTASIPETDLKEAISRVLEKGFLKDQTFHVTVCNHTIDATICDFDYPNKQVSKKKYGQIGKLIENAEISLINKSNNLSITNKIISGNLGLKLKELGIGGLSNEGKRILRKIVSERSSPLKEEFEKREQKPTKGVLLYGPPGTGKTLLARNLGKILGCGENHVMLISGTDVYNKWVGESEKNVRELFAPALEAAKKFKDDSEVFLLVIDEIDGILSHRTGEHKWSNSVVTTFLAQMDGLEEFNNILVIGMTNRREQLDSAVLRSKRFSEQIEITAPDLEGRKEIFQIYTNEMEKKGLLEKGIDFDLLASKTEGFTGADLAQLVKKASDYAIERLEELVYANQSISDRVEGLTTMNDFINALNEMQKLHSKELPEAVKMMYG